MLIAIEQKLANFEAWQGGKATLEQIKKYGEDALQKIEDYLEEIFYDHIPEQVEINDFLWFEDDTIAELLGFKNIDEFWNK